MFSNHLIKSLAKNSDEANLKLSKEDWHHVLNANKSFTEEKTQWKGNFHWGNFLKLRPQKNFNYDFTETLELCCGNGFLYFSLKNLVKFDNSSYHMDLSKQQLEDFKLRCEATINESPNMIFGDIGSIPFENEKFKIVYGYSYLHHLPDVEQYLIEAFRVLRKGGLFYAFHEPNTSALFLENFPINLFKKINSDSLTDIWLIKPSVIEKLMYNSGFSNVYVYPGDFFYSLLIRPFYFLFIKLGLNSNLVFFIKAKIFLQKIDNLLPMKLRRRICPSLCIIGVK